MVGRLGAGYVSFGLRGRLVLKRRAVSFLQRRILHSRYHGAKSLLFVFFVWFAGSDPCESPPSGGLIRLIRLVRGP